MPNPEDFLSRGEVVAELQRLGYPVTLGGMHKAALTKNDNGPAFERIPNEPGRPARYRWADCLAWARQTFLDPAMYATRKEIAEILTRSGYPITAGTLRQWHCYNGGPPCEMQGGISFYPVATALKWAEQRREKVAANKRKAAQ